MFVDGVEAKLEEGLAVLVGVRAGDVRRPVSNGLRFVAPNAPFVARARRVDVVAYTQLDLKTKRACGSANTVRGLLCGGRVPVVGIGNSQGSGRAVDNSGNQHGFIARQDCLAERALLASLVDHLYAAGSLDTVRLVLKRLLGLTTIAVQSTVLQSISDYPIPIEESTG